jgi:hypothetical protein
MAQYNQPPEYSVTINNCHTKGYYFIMPFSSANGSEQLPCNMILDHKGNVVYFQYLKNRKRAADFKLQPGKRTSYFENGKYYLLDSAFSVNDSVSAAGNLECDNHELYATQEGGFLLLANEKTKADLSGYPLFMRKNMRGSKNGTVITGVIQEFDRNKKLVWQWRSAGYFDIKNVDPYYLYDTVSLDLTHFNSIQPSPDGNLIVSARYFNEITKVNRTNGSIVWRLGGKRNQFSFEDSTTLFLAQHDARYLHNGNISVFDNGRPGVQPASAKVFLIDEKKLTCRLVWKYTDKENACSLFSGNVQSLDDGNTLINYGTSDSSKVMFNVVDSKGTKKFEIVFKDTLRTYRAYKYDSLGFLLQRPGIIVTGSAGAYVLEATGDFHSYYWSNGKSGRSIRLASLESVCVCGEYGLGYICSEKVNFLSKSASD